MIGPRITFFGRAPCHQVPDHPHDSQSHDAGYAEDHAHQAVVEARGVTSDPGVVERRGNGEWVHTERHADVRYGQVHRQQLGGSQHGEAAARADQDCCVSQNGQNSCKKKNRY